MNRMRTFAAGLLWLLPTCIANAQPGPPSDQMKRHLSGMKVERAFIDGGVLYGSHVFQEVHLCESGQYYFHEHRRRQTILDNEQVSDSRDHGLWDVITVQGHTGIHYRSYSGDEGP